jgi:hypothetical protein
MWNKDTHGDFTTVIRLPDGGFKFWPVNVETQAFLDTWRENKAENKCGAV